MFISDNDFNQRLLPRKLEFATQYNSSKIAVINIRDLDGVKNAINIITPDGAKIFQCISPSTKVINYRIC